MRILEIIPNLSSGGGERFVVDLCNELTLQGHEVTLMCLYDLNPDMGYDFYLKDLDKKIKVVTLGKKLGFDWSIFFNVKKMIKHIRPDIVHSHLRSLPYVFSSIGLKKIKFVHTIHNDARIEASDIINRTVRKFLFKRRLCYPVTISNESDLSFVRYYGNTIERTLILNGSPRRVVNPENAKEITQSKSEGKRVIVNVARLQPQKNQLSIVRAFVNHPELELYIVGYDNTEYAEKVRKEMPSNVHILGERSNPRDYMAAADAFMLCSVYEGMPITLIECFAVGALPLVTSVGGVGNMVEDNKNGLVADSYSSKDISELLTRFKNLSTVDIEKLKACSAASYHNYDIKNCAISYIELFSKLTI